MQQDTLLLSLINHKEGLGVSRVRGVSATLHVTSNVGGHERRVVLLLNAGVT